MIQEQLTDYISSQMKLGVSRDAIKSALVSAGWVAGDVEDTLKKVEGGGAAAGMKPMQPVTASPTATTGTATGGGPQMIKVSDLVSSPFSGGAAKSTPATSPSTMSSAKTDPTAAASKFGGTIKGNSFQAASTSSTSSSMSGSVGAKKGGMGMLIMEIVGGILILGLAGLAWYFYSGNAALAAKVSSLSAQSTSVTSQLAALQSQITASSTADAGQMGQLQAANTDLALNLSFYAVPLGTPTSTAATPIPVTLSGSISGGGKAPYAVTTPRGAKIFIVNSDNTTIGPELKTSVGQTIQLSGSYVLGSDEMTVDSISTTTSATTQ